MRKYLKCNKFKLGVIIIAFLLILLVLSYIALPYDVNTLNDTNQLKTPTIQHPFGTDEFGRDILSRIMVGTRSMFVLAIASTFISSIIGISLGVISGFSPKWLDIIIQRFVDIFIAIPNILLLLIFISIAGTSLKSLILAIGLSGFPTYVRLIRAKIFEVKNLQMITWAKMIGIKKRRIITHYIFPQLLPIIVVSVAYSLSTAVLVESSLSYLGFINPNIPSWGGMLADAQTYLLTRPFYAIVPATMITITVLACNLIADTILKEGR